MNKACLEIFDEVAPFRGFFAPLKELAAPLKERDAGISLYEDDDAVYLEAPVCGVKPEDIQVTFDRRGVSIEGKAAEEQSNVRYHLKSSRNVSYWVPLPSGRIDENGKVEATSKDGILKLVFPKSRAAKPLKIAVKSV
jgi:HSP20 family protein